MKSPAIFRIDVQVRVLRLRATAATNGIISFLEPRHGVRRLDGSSLCLTSSRVTGSRNGGDRVHGIVRRAVRNCCCASDVTDSNKKLLQHVIRGSGRARAGGGFGSLEDWRAHDIIAQRAGSAVAGANSRAQPGAGALEVQDVRAREARDRAAFPKLIQAHRACVFFDAALC